MGHASAPTYWGFEITLGHTTLVILRTSYRPSRRPLPDTAQHSQEKNNHAPWVAVEPAISASDWPQTHAEDHAATGIDLIQNTVL